MGTVVLFRLVAPAGMPHRDVGAALADAVNELRAVDVAFTPCRDSSLVRRVRRNDLGSASYPPVLREVTDRCARVRVATGGWFDPWAVPGGFDPSGLVKGWAIERAGARLLRAGIRDFAINGGGDVLTRGRAPHGGPWRVGVRHPERADAVVMELRLAGMAVATSGGHQRGGHIVDPHTGRPVTRAGSATVVGPDLGVADAYATALYAAGPPGLSWFTPGCGYDALLVDGALIGCSTDGFARHRSWSVKLPRPRREVPST